MPHWVDGFIGDIRYALRSLAKNLTFSLGAGAVLALGIGANVAIFSVINTILLERLDYPDADRIASIGLTRTDTGVSSPVVSGAEFQEWKARNSVFEAMAYTIHAEDLATVVNGRAEFVNGRRASSDFFAVFGQSPAAGRFPTREDANIPVVVVSYHWAQSHFGSAAATVGKPLTIYGRVLEIVGVAAPGFQEPGAADIWVTAAPLTSTDPTRRNLHVVARLKPGVEIAAAQAEMRTTSGRLAAQFPENRFYTANVRSLQDHLTSPVRSTLWLLMGAILVVLLIACANIANLLLARAVNRTREMALRAAVGAGRGRLVRQLFTESLALGVGRGRRSTDGARVP
jgi:putative ABC transport system permease protein